jgi:hypothetical protein
VTNIGTIHSAFAAELERAGVEATYVLARDDGAAMGVAGHARAPCADAAASLARSAI